MTVPIEQQAGAWNRKRHKKNLEEYRKQYGTPIKARVSTDEKFPDDPEGSVEVLILNNGKAGALRQHLKSGGEWNNGRHWRRS